MFSFFRNSFDTKKRIIAAFVVALAIIVPTVASIIESNRQTTRTDASGGQVRQDEICRNEHSRKRCAKYNSCITRPDGQIICEEVWWGSCRGDGSTNCELSPACKAIYTGPCSRDWYDNRRNPEDCSRGSFDNPSCYKECVQEAPNPFYQGERPSCDIQETGVRCLCAGSGDGPPAPQSPVPSSPPPVVKPPICEKPKSCLPEKEAYLRCGITPVFTNVLPNRCSTGATATQDGICCEPKLPSPTPTKPVLTPTATPTPTPGLCPLPKVEVEMTCPTCNNE